MDIQPKLPDIGEWTENLAERMEITDKGNPVGAAKFFFRFDLKNPDKRFRKIMQRCMIFYAFKVDIVIKEWIEYADDGNGEIKVILFSAILIDRINDKWVIGMPNSHWSEEVHYNNGKVSGMTLTVITTEGPRSVYIKNPDYKK